MSDELRTFLVTLTEHNSKSVIVKAWDEDAALDVAHDLYYDDKIKIGPEGELSNDISELTPEEEAEYGDEYERWVSLNADTIYAYGQKDNRNPKHTVIKFAKWDAELGSFVECDRVGRTT